MPEPLVYDIEHNGRQYRIIWEELSIEFPRKASAVVFLRPEGKMVWEASGVDDDREVMMRDALRFIQSIPE
jgi:hypothetical protein